MTKKNKSINSKDLISFLRRLILSNTNVVPFIHGKAGIGKTDIISQVAESFGYHLIILNLHTQEEGDLIGIPKEKDGITIYSKPEWIGLNENNPKVIVFLDEMDRAVKNILNVSLTLVREFRIHTHKLPKSWKIIAAGNSGVNDDFYDTNEIDLALKSRFVHLWYELNYKEWLEWRKENNINSYIIEYIKQNPKYLIEEPKDSGVFAYPNPRTWNILSDALTFAPENTWLNTITGSIGEEIGGQFYTFMKTQDSKDFPIPFTDFLLNLENALAKYKTKSKNGVLNTNTTILNNLKIILKSHSSSKVVEILRNIIVIMIELEYYELVAVFFNSIKSLGKDGEKLNLVIINYLENNSKLFDIYKKYIKKINNI